MKNSFTKILAVLGAVIFMLASLTSCGTEKKEYTSFAMGSVISAVIYCTDNEDTDSLWNEICSLVNSSDKAISATDESSYISRVNASGTAKVNEYTVELLKKAVLLCNTLNRRLDITIGAVTSLWGFTGSTPRVPETDELKKALDSVNLDGVFIDDAGLSVSLKDGQKLDLGALGKGEACDIIKKKLAEKGLSACVTFGGNVLVTGKNPNGKKGLWKIGLRDPKGTENDVFAALTLDASGGAKCVSTSGSYEKCFEENGKKYHHIIDPSTGYPVENGLASVSVVCPSGLNADALSTAIFVNGLNDTSLMWLDSFGAEAVFVFDDGSVFVTDRLNQNFAITKTDNYKTVTYEEATK